MPYYTVNGSGPYGVQDPSGSALGRFNDAGGAINYALARTNNVLVKAGLYTVQTQILLGNNQTLKGEGPGRTILKLAAGTGNALTSDAWIRNSDWTNGNNHITLKGFEIDGNRTNRSRTSATDDNNIEIQGSSTSLVCDDIRVEDVYSHSSNGQGIHLRYCNNSWVRFCKATDNGRNNTDLTWNGIYLLRCNDSFILACRADSQNDRSGIKTNVCNRTIVSDCIANSNPIYGFEGGDTANSPPNNCDDVSFIGCSANSNSTDGFNWNVNGSWRIKIVGCTSKLNQQNGIVFNNITYGTIIGCIVMNNSQVGVGSWDGIRLAASKHLSVQGNQNGDDQGTHTQGNGIHLVSNACDYVIMLGNDGVGCTANSILADGGNANGINANNK